MSINDFLRFTYTQPNPSYPQWYYDPVQQERDYTRYQLKQLEERLNGAFSVIANLEYKIKKLQEQIEELKEWE